MSDFSKLPYEQRMKIIAAQTLKHMESDSIPLALIPKE